MKKLERDFIIAWIVGMLLPFGILMALTGWGKKGDSAQPDNTGQRITDFMVVPQPIKISILSKNGNIVEMELENYLVGVVLAEMPVDFEPEALKAQSVVARTYTLRRLEKGARHPSAAVCMDPACCQGYVSPEDYCSRGGAEEGISKVAGAVLETAGEVLTYQGSLIDATYFSSSGGMTEDAAAVWGTDVPYLRSTFSPDEEGADHVKVISVWEVEQALDVFLEGEPEDWFEILSYTDGGGVEEIRVGGEVFSGVRLRQLLALRSTAFSVEAAGDEIVFHTSGYGHRVGMSQYGADAMAVSGHTYDEILAHYYSGTTLEQYQPGN